MTTISHASAPAATLTAPSSVLINDANSIGVPTLTDNTDTTNSKNIDSVSQDFEAVFLTQMMQQMFAGDELTQYFGGGTAGEVYKSYLLDQYGKSMAKAGGIGIATMVKQELLKLQEVKP